MSLRVQKHDIGTYLVSSRTRDEIEHLVDLSDNTCSCEAALDFKTTTPEHPCAHVEAALAFDSGQKLTRRNGGSPTASLGCKTEDF